MRRKIKFNNNWKTVKVDNFESDLEQFFSTIDNENPLATSIQTIDLPHLNSAQELNSSGGRCAQDKTIYWNTIPQISGTENKLLIEFEGIMMHSIFYINGKFAFEHKCGYTPIVFDLKPFLNKAINTIVICVSNQDNNQIPPGKPQRELDYNYDGGIYRSAWITPVNQVHFTHPIAANKVASGGIHFSTIEANNELAKIKIVSDIACPATDYLELQHQLIDYKGQVVATHSDQLSTDGLSTITNKLQLEIENPLLWSPNEPYLYTLKSSIFCNDICVDTIETTVGIRDLNISYEHGFNINGVKMKVSGGNYHQSFGQLGNALPENLLRRDARHLKKAGFDHIRTHYPLAEAFIDECDKLGLMLTISNPGWQYFEQGDFEQLSYQNMRDIIRWLRNHPSIVIWEANLNESHMSDDFMQQMQELVHLELPDGNNYTGSHSSYSDILYTNIDPDMIFDGLEINDEDILKPAWVREYGDNPDNWSDQSTVWRTKRGWGEHLMLRQVNRLIGTKYDWMTSYTDMYNSKHVVGFGLWPAIEYNRGYHINPCYGGILDLQRLPKYSYYFMQSQKSPTTNKVGYNYQPMLFIANSCTELAPDDITIYTNCDYAKLYYNDEYIATEYPTNISIKHPPIIFDGSFRRTRDRSKYTVEGYIDNQLVVTETKHSHGVARQLQISLDEQAIEFTTTSDDIVVVCVEAVDDLGNRVIYGCDEFDIKLEINDGGTIIGDCQKKLELGITSFLIRGANNELDIELLAKLTIDQPYQEVAVRGAQQTIKKRLENVYE